MSRMSRTLAPLLLGLLAASVSAVPISGPRPWESHEELASGARVVAKLPAALGGGILTQKPVTGLCDDVNQYAGYFNVTTSTKHYFYWFFESRNAPATDPVVLWMTGGPGCSGSMALFNENGPCAINKDLTTRKNPYSWNTNASVIFVDQPAGTGYSYGDPSDMDHNEAEVSQDMYHFLQAFYTAHPALLDNPFHVFGESYGGHYVPATALRIQRGNQKAEGLLVPLKGMSAGNGLTAPEVQYLYYSEMAFHNSVRPLVSKVVYEAMKVTAALCVAQIKLCQKNITQCEVAFTTCALSQVTPVQATGLNLYDIREQCKVPPLCYDFDATTKFLNAPAVMKALGTTGHPWTSCNFEVNGRFHKDWMHGFSGAIPELLGGGVRVLIYAGDMDYICNWMGNKAWTLGLGWEGKDGFNAAGDHPWTAGGEKAGLARTYGNFTFLQVYGAGHMVPMDQPEASLEMLQTFLDDRPFYTVPS